MTSVMSNNFRSSFIAVVCSLSLGFSAVVPARAEGNSAAATYPTFSTEDQGSVVGEAARAVVGRVFGVKGDAGNVEYHAIELTTRSPRNAALRSALVPGWGQHFNRQPVKGTLFFLSTVAAAVGGLRLYDKSQDTFDEYERRGEKNSSLYEDYSDERTQAVLLGGLAGVLWVWSGLDAYRNAYTPLYTKDFHVEFALLPEEGVIRFNKKF